MLGTWAGKSRLLIPGRNLPFLTLSATYFFPSENNDGENIEIYVSVGLIL